MTEPLDVLIQTALMTQLTVPALTSPATPIASPLIAYVPVPLTKYLDARPVMRAASEHFGLAFANGDIHRGIFQVDAVVPDNQGEAPGVRLASLVAARFPIGLTLTAGSFRVRFESVPTIGPAIKDGAWVRFPVSIPYIVRT